MINGKLVYTKMDDSSGDMQIGDEKYWFIDVHDVLAHDDGNAEERAKYICDAVNNHEEIKHLLNIAWDAIQEAGYEDFCSELKKGVEKYLE